ncbi:MAG: hypothetical protein WCY09_01900 [Candidatus Omnitrophota bacterium]
MKKTLLALLVVMFFSSLGFAQEVSAPASQPALKLLETKTFTGKVEWLTSGDSVNKTGQKIMVADENGKSLSFEVKTSASITGATTATDKDGNPIALSAIVKGSKVFLEYAVTKKSINKLKSIRLLE